MFRVARSAWGSGLRLMLAVMMLAGLVATGSGAAQAAPLPVFRVSAPKAVAVNQPIELMFAATGISNIAGYETNVLYDPTAAEFDGLSQGRGDLAALGRDVTAIGPVELKNGVSFGVYSCVVQDCRTRNGARQGRGGNGTVALGLLSITPRQAGTLVLRVTGTKVVDAAGKTLAIAGAEQKIIIQVGTGSTKRFAAPTLAVTNGKATKASSLDLNNDSLVSFTDVSEATLAWTLNRRAGTRCSASAAPYGDVNGDGCVDVADLQSIVANYSAATARQRPSPADTRRGVSPEAVGTAEAGLVFTVNSTADTADANIGDGVCRTKCQRLYVACGDRRSQRASGTRYDPFRHLRYRDQANPAWEPAADAQRYDRWHDH